MSTEVAKIEAPEDSTLAMIERLAKEPGFDVQKFAQLIELQKQHESHLRRRAFDDSLARVQAVMPRVIQNGLIDYGQNKAKIPYAKLEDIDAVIRPIYSSEGFAVRWNTEDVPLGEKLYIRVTGTFSCSGHSEMQSLTLPPDTSGGKNGAQAIASTVAYGKRQILKMFFHIIEEGKDIDGAKREDLEPISPQQCDDLRVALESVDANIPAFTKHFRIDKLSDMRRSQLDEAYRMIGMKKAKR